MYLQSVIINMFCVVNFMLINAALIVIPLLRFIFARRNYDQVKAVCIRVDSFEDYDPETGKGIAYQPVWEYYYNGTMYTSSMRIKSSFYNIQVGTEKLIYVSPEKPEEIYVPCIGLLVVFITIGVISLAFSSLPLFLQI